MKKLKKELTALDLFCIAAGAMISSGLFVLPSIVYRHTGPATILSYAFAGVFMIPAIFSKIELATAMPKSGGSYFFIERSLGPLPGTLTGLSNWLSISLKSAFALVGIGTFITLFYPEISYNEVRAIAISFCILFTIINLLSVKTAGRIQIFLVLTLIGILSFYAFYSLKFVNVKQYFPFAPYGIKSIFSTAGMVFISYGGLTKVASVSEEVKNPGKTIPLGIITAFIAVEILYLLVISITIGLVEPEKLKATLVPISLGGYVSMGTFGIIITSIAALIAYITTANAGIMSASRSPMAMSRDNLLPQFFGKINKKYFTPYVSILITSAFMCTTILLLDLESLVKFASTLMLLLFIFINIAVIIMRESKIKSYRPKFNTPLYPYLQILGILVYSFLIFEMGKTPLLITLLFLIIGIGWYFVYVRQRLEARQYALMYVVTKISAKEIQTSTLEDELREIIIERDDIKEDRFDKLIKKCKILDFEKPLKMEEFFNKISQILSKTTNINTRKIYNLFIMREKESTTVLHPGLAIPHIVIPGRKKFIIIPVRCKKGIYFSNAKTPVKTVFILAGSKDERNFHLKALMAIAQIVQSEDFEKLWLEARNIQELRNIILLASRKRSKLNRNE